MTQCRGSTFSCGFWGSKRLRAEPWLQLGHHQCTGFGWDLLDKMTLETVSCSWLMHTVPHTEPNMLTNHLCKPEAGPDQRLGAKGIF